EQLIALDTQLDRFRPVLQGDWSPLRFSDLLRATAADESATTNDRLDLLIEGVTTALRQPKRYRSPWPSWVASHEASGIPASRHLTSNGGRFGFVLLRLADSSRTPFDDHTAIGQLRGVVRKIGRAHAEVDVGLTGLPVMEDDEMESSRTATMQASVLSLVGVAFLFIAGFGGLRHPLLTVATLGVGIAWSVGYVTLVVGHLNILSMSFGVILIGLGIDFSIHYLARYQQLRTTGDAGSGDALLSTAISVGPGIMTGGLTTAIAFFTAALTEFTGVAELGVIAGGGILLCLAASMLLLPALIFLNDRHGSGPPPPAPVGTGGWVSIFHRFPAVTVAMTLLVTLLIGRGIGRLSYDHNLLNLQPVGLESVAWEQRLIEESDQSLWYALSVANDRRELLALKQRFTKLSTVERTEEIASLLPDDVAGKRPLVARIHARTANLPVQPGRIPVDTPATLRSALADAKSRWPTGHPVRESLQKLDDLVAGTPASECIERLAYYQQRMAADLLGRLRVLQAASSPEPPRLSDLPPSLVRRFVGQDGHYLLKIYSRGNIWDMDALRAFVTDVRSVDPEVTGKPLQTFEASRQMQQSYIKAAFYSLGAVTLILLIDFRNLSTALLALLPVGLGTLLLFGLLGLLDIPLNPANMIVLPLILGIGIDDGVHVVHDYRSQRGAYRLTRSTSTAVLMTSLTSMVGFGSLMIASHRGLESLGRVLTIGISCCLVTSLVTLPALLAWYSRWHGRPNDDRFPDRAQPSRQEREPRLPQVANRAGAAVSIMETSGPPRE
ncbi:MAG: MMPL family transporter, partial [Pirellulales bacterium]